MNVDDFLMCRNCTVVMGEGNTIIPACKLNQNIPCDNVLQYGDEGCQYEREEEEE